MGTSINFSTTTPRPDIRDTLQEFDVDANAMGFVGAAIAPAFESGEAFGEYTKIEAKDLLKDVPTMRNRDGSYNTVGGKIEKDSFKTQEHGIQERIDEHDAAVYRNWYDAERLAVMRIRHVLLQAHNNMVIAKADALTGGQAAAAAEKWDESGNASDPVADVRAACIALRDRIGMITPVQMVMEWETFQFLKDTPAIID